MRQLTSLDQQFLALETHRQYGHVAGLAVLDPSTRPGGDLTLHDLLELFRQRLPLAPPLRWRLAEVPFGLDYSYWVDDPDFDLEFHVREVALPSPGNDSQLAEQVARIVARPLDRTRPLWETYLIHGLDDGHVAVLTKIHHAVVDGISGAEILVALLDMTPEGRDVPQDTVPGEQMPSNWELLGRGLLGIAKYPVRVARSLPKALPNLGDVRAFSPVPLVPTLAKAVNLVSETVEGPSEGRKLAEMEAPRVPFSGPVSAHRRVAFGQLALDAIKEAKNKHGVSVNDVVVSICAGAVRRWLVAHGALPPQPLVAQIPVSVRNDDQRGTFGNRILLLAAPLFTDEADPVERLRRTHESLGDMKDRHKALPAELLQDANNFIPPALFSLAARSTMAMAASRPGWNLVVSNVPGPQFPLYLAGARLVAQYPISVITDGMGLNITVQSYNGHVDIGIVADRDQMPDVDRLVGWMRDELELLCKEQ